MGDNMNTSEILTLVKQDLLITSNIRDEYIISIINSCKAEFSNRGIKLNENNIDDTLLLTDYVSWRYRHRESKLDMPEHLKLRIANKKLKGRLKIE